MGAVREMIGAEREALVLIAELRGVSRRKREFSRRIASKAFKVSLLEFI